MNKNKYCQSILIDESINEEFKFDNKNFSKNNFIDENVNLIFSNSSNKKEKILFVGQVQSGKTKNIIYLIKKAMDLNYNCVVFFAGINHVLLKQGDNRLKDELNTFENKKYKIIRANNIDLLNNYLNSNEKFVICTLKEGNIFKKLYDSFSNKILEDKKILFIDDESDYGSINTGSEICPTLFYKKIEALYKRMEQGKLIYFTATPFANILNSETKKNPPRVIVLKHYNDYYGIDKFNLEKKFYISKWDDKKEIKNNYSLIYESIIIHLYYACKLIIFKNKNSKTQLLINYFNITDMQEEILSIAKEILEELLEKFDDQDEYYIKKIFIEKLESFELNEEINIFKENFIIFFKEVKNVIKYILDNKSFYTLNGKNKEYKEFFLKRKFNHEIIIGGIMLSRGVTFENLVVELILNYPNLIAVDTLLQRCRWFGNRKYNEDFIKIIMTKKLIDAMKLTQKYVNLFTPGEHDYWELYKKIKNLDEDYNQKRFGIVSTSNEKSK